MSDETAPPRKSRSTSDAERRRARRAQKILGAADSRLHRITATYSSNLSSEAHPSPLTSKKSSPQHSQKSSPTTSEAPDSPFSSRRNTGNLGTVLCNFHVFITYHSLNFFLKKMIGSPRLIIVICINRILSLH